MFRHYLNLSLRVLKKQRLFAAINIVGLSIAFAVVLLIMLFIRDEYTFDRWHDNADNIFSVEEINYRPDGSVRSQGAYLPFPLAESLKRDHPAVATTVRMLDNSVVMRIDGITTEETVVFVDSTFFDVFTYNVMRGGARTALNDPASIVMTESSAMRHFGSIDVVGRDLEIRFEDAYLPTVVTAIVQDPPSNSSLQFEYLLPFHRTPMVYEWVAGRVDRWNASSFNVFALLHAEANLEDAQATAAGLWPKYNDDRIQRLRERGQWEGDGSPAEYTFMPLKDLHISGSGAGGRTRLAARAATGTYGVLVPPSAPHYSLILGAIGLTILILACINFVILSIGRGATRAAEIGLRKALGAHRSQLVTQFGSESIVLSAASVVLGLALATVLLPVFNGLSGKGLSLDFPRDITIVLALAAVAGVTGILAGWYPSVVISRHRPADALRGRFQLGGSNRLTKSLVVAQFAASIVLVAVALVMHQQINTMQHRDLGFSPDNVIVVHANRTDGRELTRHLERTIGNHTGVEEIAAVSFSMNRGYSHEGWRMGDEQWQAYVYNVEPEAIDVLGATIVAGRAFDPDLAMDSTFAVVINEQLAAQLGYTPDEAVGKPLLGYDDPAPNIVGVVRDLNFQSLHVGIEPMMFTMDPRENMRYALVKTTGSDYDGLLSALENSWQSFAPEIPLSYSFLDDDVMMTYRNDQRWSRVVSYAAALAIIIACMGLFGLAALTISRRTKEIGVRKVLGASVSGILILVTRDFARLVAVATLLAVPVAYFALTRWLEGFAYRVPISVWVFGLAGVVVLAVALATVSYHALRASIRNPVDALRYE